MHKEWMLLFLNTYFRTGLFIVMRGVHQVFYDAEK